MVEFLIENQNIPGVKQVIIQEINDDPRFAQVILQNHWEADALEKLESLYSDKENTQQVSLQAMSILDEFSDQPKVKALMFNLLGRSKNCLGIFKKHHWEAETLFSILNTFLQTNGENYDPDLITFLSQNSDSPRLKDALFNILTNNGSIAKNVSSLTDG